MLLIFHNIDYMKNISSIDSNLAVWPLADSHNHEVPPLIAKDRGNLPEHVIESFSKSGGASFQNQCYNVGVSKLILQNIHHLHNELIVSALRVSKPRSVNNLNQAMIIRGSFREAFIKKNHFFIDIRQ